jgi:hypothetical protein
MTWCRPCAGSDPSFAPPIRRLIRRMIQDARFRRPFRWQ